MKTTTEITKKDNVATFPNADDRFTEKQAAQIIGKSVSTLFRLRRAGRIGFYRVGDTVLYSRTDIENFLAECYQPADQKMAA